LRRCPGVAHAGHELSAEAWRNPKDRSRSECDHAAVQTFVWVTAWEQQCCGDGFEVGSTVTWTVVEHDEPDEWVAQLLSPEWGNRVTYSEGHHDDEEATLSGVVRAIHEMRCRRELQPCGTGQAWVPIQGSGWLTEVSVADPWVSEPRAEVRESMSFDGWVVELDATK
jgi:hypothetical protein